MRFLFDAAYHGARFVQEPHIGAKYRILQDSLSRRDPAGSWQDVLLNGQQIEAIWRRKGALDAARLNALAHIYNNCSRGLFATSHPKYFKAIAMQRRLGLPLPRHTRLVAPLARVLGLRTRRGIGKWRLAVRSAFVGP